MRTFIISISIAIAVSGAAHAKPPALAEGAFQFKIKDHSDTAWIVDCGDGSFQINRNGNDFRPLVAGKNEWYRLHGKDGDRDVYTKIKKKGRTEQAYLDENGKFRSFGGDWKGRWQIASQPVPANIRSMACK